MTEFSIDLDALKRDAAAEMSEGTDLSFKQAHDLIGYFLGDIREDNLYNIIIKKEDLDARQQKGINILKNIKELKLIDFAEGVGSLGAAVVAQAGGEFYASAILAGVFLVRTAKKLSNVPLQKKHALVILGLYNRPTGFNNLQPLLDFINTEYKNHPEVKLPVNEKELKVILGDLHVMGIVNLEDEPIVLKDKVTLQ